MANVQYTENLTEDQLDAMAGGETLRYQATSFGVTRNNKVLCFSFFFGRRLFDSSVLICHLMLVMQLKLMRSFSDKMGSH
jgi:hypothetical protein